MREADSRVTLYVCHMSTVNLRLCPRFKRPLIHLVKTVWTKRTIFHGNPRRAWLFTALDDPPRI